MESDLIEEHQIILGQLRKNVVDVVEPHHDDRFLQRWLRARNFDLEKAEKMLRDDLKLRKKIGSDRNWKTFAIRKELKPYECTVFLGFDVKGQPVRFFNLGACDFIGFSRATTITEGYQNMIFVMEHDWNMLKEQNEKTGKHAEKFNYIADFTDFKLKQFCDKEVIRCGTRFIKFYQDHYPEQMNSLNIINVPNLFLYVFSVFKPFFDEKVLKKIKIFSDDSWQKDVFQTIPSAIVPAYVGGSRFEPEGDPMCHGLLNWKSKIPASLHMAGCGSLRSGDPGVREKVVRERSAFEVEVAVDRRGSILCWEFQTKEYNIKFGLFCKRSSKQEGRKGSTKPERSDREELVAIESMDCHQFPETGEFLCPAPGTYILHFDNTYSWLKSKHLSYKTGVREATTSG